MSLTTLISNVRGRVDDYGTTVKAHHTDDQVRGYINKARRIINNKIRYYENQMFITPELYIDEYSLPTDFVSLIDIYDVYNQKWLRTTPKPNVESLKSGSVYYPVTYYGNLFYLNEKRNVLTLLELPITPEPTLVIQSYSRTTKKITLITALSNVSKWITLKGHIKISNAYRTEYNRVSNIVDGGTNTTPATGTVSMTSGTNTITGSGTTFATEFNVDDPVLVYNGATLLFSSTVATIDSGGLSMTTDDTFTGTSFSGEAIVNGGEMLTLYISSFDVIDQYPVYSDLAITGTVTNSSGMVVGQNSKLMCQVAVGDWLALNNGSDVPTGTWYQVTAVNTDLSITIASNAGYPSWSNSSIICRRPRGGADGSTKQISYPVKGDTLQFQTYIMNYTSQPKELYYYDDSDKSPNEFQDYLIPLKASQDAWLKQSRQDMASVVEEEYLKELERIEDQYRQEKAYEYNNGYPGTLFIPRY